MELKDYSFAIFFLTALLCILTVFTAIFFDGVIASNTSTIIKRYVTNAAMIDSSVAETVAWSGKCVQRCIPIRHQCTGWFCFDCNIRNWSLSSR